MKHLVINYDCLNLYIIFAKTYKMAVDESAYNTSNGKLDPWYYQIPCKYGYIYPYSSTKLAFYCEGYKIKQKIIRELPEIELIQDGDIEGVFIFTPDQFDKIAKYARPKKRRRLSEKHRNILMESNQCYRFKSKKGGSDGSLGSQERISGTRESSDMAT